MRQMVSMVSGAALGVVVGAGLMLMPQTRPIRKAILKSMAGVKRSAGSMHPFK